MAAAPDPVDAAARLENAMIAKNARLALLLATSAALGSLACDVEDADAIDTALVDRAALSLDDGAELLFIAEEDGEVTIIEADGTPGLGHLAPLDEGATPAELWVSLTGAGADADAAEIPDFLVEHHRARVDRELDLDLVLPTPRSLEYPERWGGTDRYCGSFFDGQFDAYNPETTQVSVASDDVLFYGYSNAYVQHAWAAVCNNTPLSQSGTKSGIGISTWNATYSKWMPVYCPANICATILNQEAQAIHYWTSALAGNKLRFEAKNTGGVIHTSELLAGFKTLGF